MDKLLRLEFERRAKLAPEKGLLEGRQPLEGIGATSARQKTQNASYYGEVGDRSMIKEAERSMIREIDVSRGRLVTD